MVLEEGKHCVVETPIALSLKEVDYLIRLAHKKRAVLSVFQSRRFDGDFLTVKKILEEGQLGEPAVPVWNFHKILIGKDGAAIRAFGPRTDPQDADMTAEIVKAL